ncbi:hypothetical protein DY000_02023608 [Brassica cretica]|uniref:Uncharacterized protein n=1 Tax=Brassica cretica TaxID=69181 RepID=A0ABQ7EC79_BRACR|nr:hypothetical protein DY000_02023608 [Brassica cretica]
MRYPQRRHENAHMPLSPQQNGYTSHDLSANEYFIRLPRPIFGTEIDCEIHAFHSVTERVHRSVAS